MKYRRYSRINNTPPKPMPKRANNGARQDTQNAVPATPANNTPAPPPTVTPMSLICFLLRMEYTCIVTKTAYNIERKIVTTKSREEKSES